MNRSLLLAALVCAAGCPVSRPVELDRDVGSFTVKVSGIYLPGTTTLAPVVERCRQRYGGQQSVPPAERGTADCQFQLPSGPLDVALEVRAIGLDGRHSPLEGAIAIKAVPGDLAEEYRYRWGYMRGGALTTTVRVSHVFGKTRFWAEDAPPQPIYVDGGLSTESLPAEVRTRTYATGASPVVHFAEPTLAALQMPDVFDNTSSPFVGQFLVVGQEPGNGAQETQECQALPDGGVQPEHGQAPMLVVTGTDQTGFFVTDLTACRVPEKIKDQDNAIQVRVPEPNGLLPGTFGSMFIYNFSFPEGLEEGDLIWSVSGSIQEFTGTTQLTFPAWLIRERVRDHGVGDQNKYLSRLQPTEINGRICGLEDKPVPFLTDALCGHNKRNLKLESLESGLVRVRHVRLPERIVSCDANGDQSVPFFCEGKNADGLTWAWQDCDFESSVPGPDAAELSCNIDCVTGQGAQAGQLCAERTTLQLYGQFPVQMAAPGLDALGMDSSLSTRFERLSLGATSRSSTTAQTVGTELAVACTAPAVVKFGGAGVSASPSDLRLPAGTVLFRTLANGETNVAVLADPFSDQPPSADAACSVGINPKLKISLMTKDALPDFKPDCDANHPDIRAATNCKNQRGATYDVVGHLRQTLPSRPRWTVIPRDGSDVCCHPGPGLQCPNSVKPCP